MRNLQILSVVGLTEPLWIDTTALFYSIIALLLHGSGTVALCGKSIGGLPGCVNCAVSKPVVFGGRLLKLCRHLKKSIITPTTGLQEATHFRRSDVTWHSCTGCQT